MIQPFPYQIKGAGMLAASRRLGCFDEPGLGKTLQALLAAMPADRRNKVAVLCPAIARSHWTAEAAGLGMTLDYLESYDRYVRNVGTREALRVLQPDILILDEAHLLGSMVASRTRDVLLQLRRTPVIWPLTGTPLRSGPAGLYPLLATCFPEELKARGITGFRNYLDEFATYYTHRRWGVQVTGLKDVEGFQHLVDSIGFRRTAKEVLPELPPISWERLLIDPLKETAELATLRSYQGAGRFSHIESALHDEELPDTAPERATLQRLVGEAKAEWSAQIIAEELAGGTDKVFVAAYHRAVLDTLQTRLAPYGVVRIDGDTTQRERDAAVARFQDDPHTRVFLGQVVSVQMSLTLTAAAVCHLVEPTWVPDDNEQIAKRIHRISQDRPVKIRLHALAGTIDESVTRVLLRKQQINQQALRAEGVTTVQEVRRV